MATRIILNILLFASILFLHWWVSIFIALILLVLHKSYELVLWGIFADSLYSSVDGLFGIQFIFTLIFILILLISIPVKKRVIFYGT